MEKMKLNIQRFTASCSVSVTSCTQSIDNNSSTIKIKGTLTTSSTTYNYGGAYMKPTISNQPVVGTQKASQTLTKKKFSIDKGDSVSGTWTFTVYHNDDGTCNNLSIATEWYVIDQYQGTKTISYKPATIARASNISVADGTLNTQLTINITRKNDTFVHTLRYVCGEQSGWIKDTNNKVATSASWTPPLALASENKSGQSVQCTIYCQTYNSSGSTVGTEQSQTITLTIPTLNPQNVSIGSIADANSYKNTYGVFIQNKSRITATLNGTAQYSDINSYLWEIRQTNASGTLLANGNTNSISYSPNTSGTLYVYGKVTDKRGAYTTTSTTVSVTAYSPPTCQLAVSRVSSTSASYTMSGNGTSISTAGYTANTLEFKLVRGSTTVRTTSSGSSYTGTDTINDQSYTYTLTAKDTISGTTDTKTVTISTTFTLMNFNSTGYGMAIGKASEATGTNKLLEIALPTTISENVTATNITSSATITAKRFKTLYLTGGNGNTTGYRKIATFPIGTWTNRRVNFSVASRHSGCGLLCVSCGNNTGTVSAANVYGRINYYGNDSVGGVISDTSYSLQRNSDGTEVYLYWKFSDNDIAMITVFGTNDCNMYSPGYYEINNGEWTTSIPAGLTQIAGTRINYAGNAEKDLSGNVITSTYQKVPTSLYTYSGSDGGATGNITLSSSAANFTRLEIFYMYYNTDNYKYKSTSVYSPNGKIALLDGSYDNGTYYYTETAQYTISGTALNRTKATRWRIGTGGANSTRTDTTSSNQSIRITKVVGYV